MDIAIINKNTIKIKGKNASLVVDPQNGTPKTEADAIVLLRQNAGQDFPKIAGSRITIKGPGEYEINGVKISTTKVNGNLVAGLDVDSIKILIGSGESIEKIHDKIEECDIALVGADGDFNYAVLTSLEPKTLILYGEKKENVAKMLGKENAIRGSKYSTSLDKLPQEMEIVLLG